MALPAAEIRALARILDELDYYEMLGLQRDAQHSEVRQSYHATSRRFHPDAHRDLPEPSRRELLRIAKRITEAYSVLRDARRRRIYDDRLQAAQSPIRLQLAEAAAEADKRAVRERMGSTPNGRRFFAMAQADLDRGDQAAAARNLQMALTFEPANRFFKDKLSQLRQDTSDPAAPGN